MGAHKPDRVRVVDHHQRAILLCQVADVVQLGDVAIHGEDAVGRDHDMTRLGGGFLESGLQIVHVAVAVTESLRFRETDAVDDAGVVELVGDDRVLGVEQSLEQAAVGVEAGAVQDRVLGSEKLTDAFLKLLVDGLGAADEAHRGQPEAAGVERRVRGREDRRVRRQAEIVVRAEDEHPSAVRERHLGTLRRDDLALALPQPGVADLRELGFDHRLHGLEHDGSPCTLGLRWPGPTARARPCPPARRAGARWPRRSAPWASRA